jgi:hypothetical protein
MPLYPSHVLAPLARFARPLLLAAALLLVTGSWLTLFHMLVMGWAMYAIGHIVAIVGFVAIAAVFRERMEPWTWLGLIVLEAGLILALPGIVAIGSAYAAPAGAGQMILPADALPLGLAAELITWVGLAFFGLAARGERILSSGIAWTFVAAAVIGILGDLRLISPLVWVLAVLLLAFGLLGVGVSLRAAPTRATSSA